MKSKYLFIHSSGTIDDSTLFVDVYIGRSLQDQRDLSFFESLADSSPDYYFHIYDNSVQEFVSSVNESLQYQSDDDRMRILRCSMSAAKLRRLVKSGMYESWAHRYFLATEGLRRMNLSANSAYFCAIYRADQTLAMPRT